MTFTVDSYNDFSLQTSSYVARLLIADRPLTRAGALTTVRTPGGWPRAIRVEQAPRRVAVHVQVLSGDNTSMRELQQSFATGTQAALVVTEDGVQKYLNAAVIGTSRHVDGPNVFIAQLEAADPRWRSYLPVTAGASITTSGQTFDVENDGNVNVDDCVITVRPTVNKAAASGWLYRQRSIVCWRADRPAPNYAVELTENWDHAAEVSASRSQSDGDDVRVLVDGIEVPRWFGEHADNDANDNETRIWANIDFAPARRATLLQNITALSPGGDGELLVVKGGTLGWPRSGRILLGDEVISYTGRTESNADGRAAFTGIQRAQFNTTAAVASAGDTLYWLEHEIEIIFGHTGITAPDTRNDVKPLLDLTSNTLTNLRHEWLNFLDETNPARSMPWLRTLVGRDDEAGAILAAGGSPLAALAFEYRRDGAIAGKPNDNTWGRPFPTGLKASGFAFVNQAGADVTTTTSITITKPTNTALRDVLIAALCLDAPSTITPPAGWVSLYSAVTAAGLYVYVKVATASEPANYQWTFSSTSGTGAIVALRGVSLATTYAQASATTTSSTVIGGSVTPEVSPAIIVAIAAKNTTGTYTGPAGFTERVDRSNSNALYIGDMQSNAGAGAAVAVAAGTGPVSTGEYVLLALQVDGPVQFLRSIDDSLAISYFADDDAGSEILLGRESGPQTSAEIAAPSGGSDVNPLYSFAFYGRTQVVTSNPTGGLLASTLMANTYGATPVQQFTAPSEGLIYGVAAFVDVRAATDTLFAQLFADDGADAPAAAGLSVEASVAMVIGDNQWAYFAFSSPVAVFAGQKVHLKLRNTSGTFAEWNRFSQQYEGGVSGVADHVFGFRILSPDIAELDPNAQRDDGDAISIDQVVAALDTAGAPYVALRAREDIHRFVGGTLYNQTTGQSLRIGYCSRLNDEVQIDIGRGTAINLDDEGRSVAYAVEYSDPDARFTIAPGINTLQLVEAGLAGVSVAVDFESAWE